MKKILFCLSAIAAFSFWSQQAEACTDFSLTGKDGTVFITRSMEFAQDLKSNLRTQLRGKKFTTTAPSGKSGISWTAKFGYVYLDGINMDAVVDGMNETGLTFEALYFPGETQYQNVAAGKDSTALPYAFMGDWILGNFQTIDEVRKALSSVSVFAQKIPGAGDMVFPLHFSIYDASGKGIVVEYTSSGMKIYDNQVGILTNSPAYDWQVTNLRNYMNLSPYAPNPIVMNGISFAATGQGAGSFGLPGDITPPSRFVKINFLKLYSTPGVDTNSTLNLAEHIIDNVDIPLGTVRAKQSNGPDSLEFTQWVVFKDVTHKVLYYRSYNDLTLHSIALNKIDFSPNAARLKMPIATAYMVIDDTDKFLQQKEVVNKP